MISMLCMRNIHALHSGKNNEFAFRLIFKNNVVITKNWQDKQFYQMLIFLWS